MNVVVAEVSYRSIIIRIKVCPRRGPGYGRNSLTAAGDANKLSSLSQIMRLSLLNLKIFFRRPHHGGAAKAPLGSPQPLLSGACNICYRNRLLKVNSAIERSNKGGFRSRCSFTDSFKSQIAALELDLPQTSETAREAHHVRARMNSGNLRFWRNRILLMKTRDLRPF